MSKELAVLGVVLVSLIGGALNSPLPFPGRYRLTLPGEGVAMKIDTWTGKTWVILPEAALKGTGQRTGQSDADFERESSVNVERMKSWAELPDAPPSRP